MQMRRFHQLYIYTHTSFYFKKHVAKQKQTKKHATNPLQYLGFILS